MNRPRSSLLRPFRADIALLLMLVACGCTGNDKQRDIPGPMRSKNPASFESVIDFDNGDYSAQLDSGWYQLEEDEDNGFRWITTHAIAYVKNNDSAKAFQASFYIPDINNYPNHRLTIALKLEGIELFSQTYDSSGNHVAYAPLPRALKSKPVLRVDITADKLYTPVIKSYDPRKLAVIVGDLGLTASDTAEVE